ncbi:MAG: hypothetical protein H6577_08820 [Lewinellaceae bacterium]|nr:hypothetical protein [Saprospiraceae bacterium]MCB9338215.1 hypothetical protein [Lewinellaceae bacterium]
MQNTFLWEIANSFSKPEQREVRNFLASPFFNYREDVRALFEMLSNETEPPGKESVWAKVNPEKPFDDQQFRLLTSYLLKLLEQYLVYKENQNDPVGNGHLLLSAYRRRKLPKHFEKAQKAVAKQLENQPLRHPEFYFENYLTANQQYLHLLESGRTKDLNLQKVETQLTTAVVAMKLRQSCLLRAHQAVFNTSYQIYLLDEMLALAEAPPYRNDPGVSMYRLCYQALFGEGSDALFLKFKEQLFWQDQQFPKAEMASLYLLAINFCIKKINASQHQYLREALDLYKQGLKTELLLENGLLSRFAYNNIVGIALRLEQEWDWAGWFVGHYKDYLEPAQREATFSLNAARIAYARQRYDDALLHLQRADYKDLINSMVAKVLQLKIYFEKGELELLDAHLRTMRMFVRRNKRMGYHHRNWQNIVHFTQKLVELNPFDQQQRAALKTAIEKEEVLTEKEWLLGQL